MAKVRYVSFLAASLIVGCRSGQDVERCQMRLDSLRSSITDYRFHKGIYPASGGRALLAAMAERSELGAQFFVFPKEAVNSSGEPLDEWGSPLVYIN